MRIRNSIRLFMVVVVGLMLGVTLQAGLFGPDPVPPWVLEMQRKKLEKFEQEEAAKAAQEKAAREEAIAKEAERIEQALQVLKERAEKAEQEKQRSWAEAGRVLKKEREQKARDEAAQNARKLAARSKPGVRPAILMQSQFETLFVVSFSYYTSGLQRKRREELDSKTREKLVSSILDPMNLVSGRTGIGGANEVLRVEAPKNLLFKGPVVLKLSGQGGIVKKSMWVYIPGWSRPQRRDVTFQTILQKDYWVLRIY